MRKELLSNILASTIASQLVPNANSHHIRTRTRYQLVQGQLVLGQLVPINSFLVNSFQIVADPGW